MVTSSATVTLREITRETVREILQLNVGENQQTLVASNAVSIAEAYFEPLAWFRAIYADETPVGFIMTYENPEKGLYYLWRLMIDFRYQGSDFGRQAVEQLIARVRDAPNSKELWVSVVPTADSAAPFYEKIGFVDTGRIEDGEKVLKLLL